MVFSLFYVAEAHQNRNHQNHTGGGQADEVMVFEHEDRGLVSSHSQTNSALGRPLLATVPFPKIMYNYFTNAGSTR